MLQQPSAFIFGIEILEPVTTLTDLIVSTVCFYSFFKIRALHRTDILYIYIKYYFLSMGIATAVGGLVGHGFLYLFDTKWELSSGFVKYVAYIVGEDSIKSSVNPWKLPGWLTSMFSVALIERASIEFAKPHIKPNVGSFFSWLNIIELLTFVTITFSTLNFFFVEVHTFYGFMIIVLSFNAFVYYKTRNNGSKLFLMAVGFAAIAALFFMNKWALNKWYNHYDISHTFMAISAWLFYRGAISLEKE